MMKSFFKKLSLVMALAMVVSLAAPAASAFAADLIIAGQDEAKADAKTEYNVAVGEEVDFKFYNAGAGWQNNYKWESSDETVAETLVNEKGQQDGKFYGHKDGEVEITLTIGEQKATVKLVVGKGNKIDNSFTAKQTTASLVELTFANTKITQAEVEKGLKVEWKVTEDYSADQPFQVVSVKDGVAVVNVYGFNDGVEYVFTYTDEEPVVLKATIGEVASVEVKVFADGSSAELEHVAYVGKDATIKYTLKNAEGVDITDVALANNASAYVEFKFDKDSTNGEYWFNDMTGTASSPEGKIYFTTANKQVNVIAKFVTGKYDEKTGTPIDGPASTPYLVYSTQAPAYRLTSKVAATVATTPDWNNTTNVIALDDEMGAGNDKFIFFKFKDSDKADVFTNDATYTKGTFSYKSTNPAVAFVNPTDGKITTNTVGTTTVLVYFTPAVTATVQNPVATLVAAETVVVAAKRAVSEIVVPADKRNVVVSSEAVYGNVTYGFNSTSFEIEVLDQLKAKINSNDIKVERNKATLPEGVTAPNVTITNIGKGKYRVDVTGSAANLTTDATSYLFTFEIKATGAATQTFTVTVRKPIYTGTASNQALVVSGYDIVTNGVTDLKTTDANAKNIVASLNVQSNAVNVFKQGVAKNPGKDYKVGNFYYSVTKNGADITANATSVNGTNIIVPVTTVATSAAVNGANVVNKATSGVGTYVITVYKAVGATEGATTQALSIVQTETVNVVDTQATVAFGAKLNAKVAAGTEETMVLSAFTFTLNGATFGANGTVVPANVVVDADVKVPSGKLATGLVAGDVVFVKSVTFYVETGANTNTYTANTVAINDYITVK